MLQVVVKVLLAAIVGSFVLKFTGRIIPFALFDGDRSIVALVIVFLPVIVLGSLLSFWQRRLSAAGDT
ncbi:MAG: hypothetical protein AAF889_06605 [Cyanobacteria bacterium P01_D01_bin.73]